MTLDDLSRAVDESLATQKLGTPVAMRGHVQLADADADIQWAPARLIELAEAVFQSKPSTLTAQQHTRQRQLQVHVTFTGGQTLQVTSGCGNARSPRLHFILIGNHGTARLEGGELFCETPAAASSAWSEQIQSSLRDRQPVRMT